MVELQAECHIADIPRRLHWGGRPIREVPADDWIYMWHLPVPGSYMESDIFASFRVDGQSFNSHKLNHPNGDPRDVHYDTRYGKHRPEMQIARFGVGEVKLLDLPNKNTERKDRDGRLICDRYTFQIEHKPTPCMYPHCELVALKDGKKRTVSPGVKTLIRDSFEEIAERHREKMSASYPPGSPLPGENEKSRQHFLRRFRTHLMECANRAISRFVSFARYK